MKKFITKRNIISASIAFLFLIAIYWHHVVRYPSTDNAYLQANIVNIATQVSGEVTSLYVQNNQSVAKGAPLFDLDPRPFQLALDKARAEYELAKQQVGANIDAVKVAKAQVAQHQAELFNAQKNYQRVFILVKKGTSSKAEGDDVKAKLDIAQATLNAAQNQLLQAEQELGDPSENNAQLKAARAQLKKAKLDLTHSHIKAPAAGIVTNLTIRVGDTVQTGQPQFAFVETQHWWVDANYKETQINNIRPGQTATISVDLYPHHKFTGIVESISAGSGAVFSLLPPENATGNWVKVIQRFPVRIKILNNDSDYPFRVGASSTVTIDTYS